MSAVDSVRACNEPSTRQNLLCGLHSDHSMQSETEKVWLCCDHHQQKRVLNGDDMEPHLAIPEISDHTLLNTGHRTITHDHAQLLQLLLRVHSPTGVYKQSIYM